MWVLAIDSRRRRSCTNRVWTGTDGFYIVDQMQYLAWIEAASHHLLVSNLFVLRSTPADYFQPAVVISGGITALGVAPWLSLLLWKPVAVLGMFFAIRAYAHRTVRGAGPRRAVHRARPVLRLVQRRLRDVRDRRRHVPRLAVVGLPVRADGGRADRFRRCCPTTARADGAGSHGRRDCWARWPACCTRGTARLLIPDPRAGRAGPLARAPRAAAT